MKIHGAFFVLLLCLLSACTSEESKVKEVAVQGAKEIYQSEVREDFRKAVTGRTRLQDITVRVLGEKAQFEVQKVDLQGNQGTAVVQALTVPLKARTALMEIIATFDEKKQDNFNVPDALKMVLRQMELTETRTLQVYKLRLEKSSEWRVAKEK